MPPLNQSAHRRPRRGRLAGRALTIALLMTGVVLAACEQGQPVGPDAAAPDRPSLALNPACAGSGGLTHTDSIKTAVTWNQQGNPHRVNQLIHIEGAGSLRLAMGTVVCFGSGGGLRADNGGRLRVEGSRLSPVVLTATDLIGGWLGVRLAGTPTASSPIKNLRLEHTQTEWALSTHDNHTAAIDSAVFRQNAYGVYLYGWASSLRRSRVDTVTSAGAAAVTLGRRTTFQQNVIRGAAGWGLLVEGMDSISLLGGRIEGSGGLGLLVTTPSTGFLSTQPVRVTAGAGYPAQMDVGAYARVYSSLTYQDSLLGNARDTLIVTGGTLLSTAYATPALPWKVTGSIFVKVYGVLAARPGATLLMDPSVGIQADSGGQVAARGTQAAPVRFSGSAWLGMELKGAPRGSIQGQNNLAAGRSYLTNAHVEGVYGVAVLAMDAHAVVIDSTVFRQNGAAAWLWSMRSRISRSRVDTTTQSTAVMLQDSTTMESTLIRGSAERGLIVTSPTATVQGCEIRDSAAEGIDLWNDGIQVHDCNLVNNAGDGIRAISTYTGNVEDNWWGDAAGPAGPDGDGVSGALDYTPWRTTPYVLPYVP